LPQGGTGATAPEGVEILEEMLLGHTGPFLRNRLLEPNLARGALAFVSLFFIFFSVNTVIE